MLRFGPQACRASRERMTPAASASAAWRDRGTAVGLACFEIEALDRQASRPLKSGFTPNSGRAHFHSRRLSRATNGLMHRNNLELFDHFVGACQY